MITQRFGLLRQISTFAVVGVAATLVHYVVALSASHIMPLAWSNVAGFCMAFGVSYFGHLRYTYRIAQDASDHHRRLPKFIATACLGFISVQATLLFLDHGTRLSDAIVLALAMGTAPVVTFISTRLWVFASPKS